MRGMATLNIRNVPEEVVATLKARAARKGNSLNTEVVCVLVESAERRSVDEILANIDRIQKRIKNPPTTEEIVERIHRAREERTEQILRAALKPRPKD